MDSEVKRSGGFSGHCRGEGPGESHGMVYQVELNQKLAAPIVAECWSKAEGASRARGMAIPSISTFSSMMARRCGAGGLFDGGDAWVAEGDRHHHAGEADQVGQCVWPVPGSHGHGVVRRLLAADMAYRRRRPVRWLVGRATTTQRRAGMTAPIVVKEGKLAVGSRVAVGASSCGTWRPLRTSCNSPKACRRAGRRLPLRGHGQGPEARLSATYRKVGEALRIDGTVQDLSGANDRA